MAASYLALPSSASEADREGAHASAHYGVYSSPQPPRATVRAARHGLQSLSDTPQSRVGAVVSICMQMPPACRASRRSHSPEPPGDPPVHGTVHGRGAQITTIYDAPRIEDIVMRAGEKGARPPPRARMRASRESECGAVGSTSRPLRTTDGCYPSVSNPISHR